jgi:hypothetical protein
MSDVPHVNLASLANDGGSSGAIGRYSPSTDTDGHVGLATSRGYWPDGLFIIPGTIGHIIEAPKQATIINTTIQIKRIL